MFRNILRLTVLFSLFTIHFSLAKDDSINQDWYSKVLDNIREQEYHITFSEKYGGFQAPNRKNNLRFIYNNNGFRVGPRITETYNYDENDTHSVREIIKVSNDWEAEFTLLGYGRDGSIEHYFKGQEFITEESTAYIKDDNMQIDYTNDQKGMRQDFIINKKPERKEGFLTLSLYIKTKERIIVGADALVIKNHDAKEFMQYSSLKIWDANGRVLRGWFRTEKNVINDATKRFQIVINDHEAVYPITVDPLSTSQDWSIEYNQAGSNLGFSVATAGDVNNDGYSDVIIGAPYYDDESVDQGAAFLYLGSASGLSTSYDWRLFGNINQGTFGYCVATAGDVNGDGHSDVLISAAFATLGPNQNAGRVYLYYGTTSFGLSYLDSWYSALNHADANMGYSISTAGDVNGDGFSDFIIGAPGYYLGSQTNEGYAYVYYGSSSGPIFSPQDWSFAGDQTGARLGTSVSTAGDVNGDGFSDVIVSAPNYDNPQNDEGIVYIFHGSATGLSTTPDWSDEGDQAAAHFGSSVSTAGDYNGDGYSDIIIGSPDFDTQVAGSTVIDAGIFSIHYGSVTGISSFNFSEGDELIGKLGKSVFTAGDVNGDGYGDVIVGLNTYTDGNFHGEAHVYFGSTNGLINSPDWIGNSSTLVFDAFGYDVSTAGDVNGDGFSDVIIGIPSFSNPENQEGTAYVYHGFADGLSTTANWTAESNDANSFMGISVSSAGDVNGDGFSDVIIGANQFDNKGAAFLYHGSIDGLSLTSDWSAEGDEIDDEFGYSVSSAGDVNGDGYDDVVIGARSHTNTLSEQGKAVVFHGSSLGLSTESDWEFFGSTASNLGTSVSTAGDVNGDGFSDIIVGAPLHSNGSLEEGSAYLFHGSATGLSLTVNWSYEGNQNNSELGSAVSTAVDVNGDGFSDILVSSVGYSNPSQDEGAVFLFYGSYNGVSLTPDWSKEGNIEFSDFGSSVSTAGDVNGDGYTDVIIGAVGYNNGTAFVYHGSQNGLSTSEDWSVESGQDNSNFGISVGTAGDLNGDGYSDVIIGADRYTNSETDEGIAFVYNGSSSGLSNTENWSLESDQQDARLGNSVASTGDVNGDGFSDIIIGAFRYDDGQSNEGKAFVHYGNSTGGLDSRIRQNNPTTSNIIAAGNLTESNGEVEIGLRTKSPFGRADGRMVYEFRKNGDTFSIGSTLTNSVNFDGSGSIEDLGTNPNGKPLIENVSGLSSDYSDAYKWRARSKFGIVNNPFQKYGPWKYYSTFSPIQPYAFRSRVFVPLNIIAQVKILLEGPYDPTDNMSANLKDIISLDSPYSEDPVSVTSFPDNTVDWVLVQLRDKNDNTKVLGSRSGILLQDKTIRDIDGTSTLSFPLPADDYYVVVKHRNHLPVMSADPVSLSSN